MGRGASSGLSNSNLAARRGSDQGSGPTRAGHWRSAEQLACYRDDPRVATQRQILLDFDSTVFPLLDAMARHPEGSGVSYEGVKTWEGLVDACGSLETMLEIFDEVQPYHWMKEHPPFAGVAEFTRAIAEQGVRIHVVSDRKEHLAEDISRYLKDHGIKSDSVLCRLGIDKVSWCEERGVEVLVDDHPSTLRAAHAAGLEPLSLAFHYNAEVLEELGAHPASDWTELGEGIIAAIAERCRRQLDQEAASAEELPVEGGRSVEERTAEFAAEFAF